MHQGHDLFRLQRSQFLSRLAKGGGQGRIGKNNAAVLQDAQALQRMLHQSPAGLFIKRWPDHF